MQSVARGKKQIEQLPHNQGMVVSGLLHRNFVHQPGHRKSQNAQCRDEPGQGIYPGGRVPVQNARLRLPSPIPFNLYSEWLQTQIEERRQKTGEADYPEAIIICFAPRSHYESSNATTVNQDDDPRKRDRPRENVEQLAAERVQVRARAKGNARADALRLAEYRKPPSSCYIAANLCKKSVHPVCET